MYTSPDNTNTPTASQTLALEFFNEHCAALRMLKQLLPQWGPEIDLAYRIIDFV